MITWTLVDKNTKLVIKEQNEQNGFRVKAEITLDEEHLRRLLHLLKDMYE